MQCMKLPRFTTRTLLLLAPALAVTLWGFIEWHSVAVPAIGFAKGEYFFPAEVESYFYDSLIWLPIVFAAYCIGRKSISLPAVVIFFVAEAAAIGLWRWIFSYSF
jgi:hypothetical protein